MSIHVIIILKRLLRWYFYSLINSDIMRISRYLDKKYRSSAARILVNAFKSKLYKILGTEDEIYEVLLASLDSKHIVIARSDDGEIVGVGTYQYKGKFSLDITLSTMIEVYGVFRGIYKMFLLLNYFPTKRDSEALYVDAIAVAENYRGQGIGKLILAELEKIAIENDLKYITLDVIKENDKAKKLYEQIGFVEVKYEELDSNVSSKLGFIGYYHMSKSR